MELPYSNLAMKHWNPGASEPLILPIKVICNTSDEQIHDNIRENSKRPDWLQLEPEHDGVAILCGSGPSLADSLEEIFALVQQGGKVFAMNGAAKYLHENGITPDYQVLIDARPETAQLVGPARQHLIASQCHPDTFAKAPNPKLWHLQIDGIEDLFPEYEGRYCMVGGAASVGNTATCLAYVMGYRKLHLFGYDSSNKGEASHAFRQPMNDGEPMCSVVFNGKDYICSFTMKLQAERAMETLKHLREMGCDIQVHGYGLLPDWYNTPKEALSETEKYERLWAYPAYRNYAPGEECAATFLTLCKPYGLVIDFGCGTGRGALKIAQKCPVLCVDFTANSRDPEARHLPFLQHDLTQRLERKAPFGYCTDVMEHIPPDDVGAVIDNIVHSVDTVFFQISTVPDHFGAVINQDLHLTVRPHEWWLSLLGNYGEVTFDQNVGEASLFILRSKHAS